MVCEYEIRKAYKAILDNDFEEAVAWFQRAIALQPDNADYHFKISVTFARSSKFEKAMMHAQKALELAPNQPAYRYHCDQLQARQMTAQAKDLLEAASSQPMMALTMLNQAVRLDPLYEEGWIFKGIAHAELGEYDHAVQSIRKTVELNPNHAIATKLLATYKQKLKQLFSK